MRGLREGDRRADGSSNAGGFVHRGGMMSPQDPDDQFFRGLTIGLWAMWLVWGVSLWLKG